MTMDEESSNLSTFDIYSDLLLERQASGVSVEQLEKINAENEAKLKELTEQLEALQTQNAAVLEENRILKTNISQLFKTAQAEIKRKDGQLEELALRRPKYLRESDYGRSINDRLRDLRKSHRSYPQRTNGVDHGQSMEEPGTRHSEDRRPHEQCGENDPSRARGVMRCDETVTKLSPTGESNPNASEEKATDRCDNKVEDKHSERSHLSKETNSVSTHSVDSHKENHSKHGERTKLEKLPSRQCLSGYKIPKKTSRTHDHASASREEKGHGTSSEKKPLDHKICDSKKSATARSSSSPPRYSRSVKRDEKLHGSRRSPFHGQSRKRSRSRETLIEYSDKSGTRSSPERHSRRKRRHSSERASSAPQDSASNSKSLDTQLQKKHKGEPAENEYRDCSSKKRKSPSSKENKIRRSEHSTDKEKARRVSHRERHRSRRSSHKSRKFSDAQIADEDERTRRRHRSDRKNKSIKRAKETLKRTHSTPKKHKRHKREDSKERKHKKRHSSKKHRTRDKADHHDGVPGQEDTSNDGPAIMLSRKIMLQESLEEGEMRGSDLDETVENSRRRRGKGQNDSDVKETAIVTLPNPMVSPLQDECTVEITKNPSEKGVAETGKDQRVTAVRQLDLKGKFEEKAAEVAKQDGDQNIKDDLNKKDIQTTHDTKTGLSFGNQLEEYPEYRVREGLSTQNPQTETLLGSSKNSSCDDKVQSNGVSIPRKDDTETPQKSSYTYAAAAEGEKLTSLRQPDPGSCEYSSEHETVLFCVPSSQEEDMRSESDSYQSYTSSSPFKKAMSKPETTEHQQINDNGDALLRLAQGQSAVSSSEDDGALWNSNDLIVDTSSVPSQEQAEDAHETEPGDKQEAPLNSGTEYSCTESPSITNQETTSTSLLDCSLKVAKSQFEGSKVHISESFSEKILDVFGSNSFLASDDLESSKEACCSLQYPDIVTSQPDESIPISPPRSSGSLVDKGHNSSFQKTESFLETVQNVFGSNSFLESDDLDSSNRVPLSPCTPQQPKSEAPQSNLVAVAEGQKNAEDEQCNMNQEPKRDTVFKIFGSNGFVDDNQGTDAASSSSLLVIEQPTIHTEECTFGDGNICSKFETERTSQLSSESAPEHSSKNAYLAKSQDSCSVQNDKHQENKQSNPSESNKPKPSAAEAKYERHAHSADLVGDSSITLEKCEGSSLHSPANEQVNLDTNLSRQVCIPEENLPSQNTTGCPDGSASLQRVMETAAVLEKQYCPAESDDAADISINPPSFDMLSCSASSTHGSLLGDSGSSCHSDQEHKEDNCSTEDDNFVEHQASKKIDQTYQDVCSQAADQHHKDTSLETNNLSDGEIVSNSDSEDKGPLQAPKEKSGKVKRSSKHKRSESSKHRSRSRDKRRSSHKDKDHPSKEKGKDVKDRDKAKFLAEKMRILEERLKSHSQWERRHSYSGRHTQSKENVRLGESNSIKRTRVEHKDRRHHAKDRNVGTSESRNRQGKSTKNEGHKESKLVDKDTRSSSRHRSKSHSSRRQDIGDEDDSMKNLERRKQTPEEKKKHKNSKDHRR